MKLASIVPMKNVERTFDGNYAMLLAHLSNYYPYPHVTEGPGRYIIMDNSLIELGGAVSIETVLEAADTCKPWIDEIILPDVFQNGVATYESAQKSIDYLYENNRIGDYNLMAVCHGKSLLEFQACFGALCAIPEINCIGIPKITTKDFGSRHLLEPIWLKDNRKSIHLLGVFDELHELRMYTNPERIRSVDTCIPALFACRGPYTSVWGKRPQPTIDLQKEEIVERTYDEVLEELRRYNLL